MSLYIGNPRRHEGNPRRHEVKISLAYQKATKDSSRLGDRELYRRYFREAYENGYNADLYNQSFRDGRYDNNRDRDWNRDNNGDQNRRGRNWDRYDNYGGSFDLRQTALNAGYNEGIKEGRKRGGRSDFRNNSAYQQATQDYSSRLGDRELYKRYYRAGYENGFTFTYSNHSSYFHVQSFCSTSTEVKPDGLDESAQWGLAAIHWVRSATSSV